MSDEVAVLIDRDGRPAMVPAVILRRGRDRLGPWVRVRLLTPPHRTLTLKRECVYPAGSSMPCTCFDGVSEFCLAHGAPTRHRAGAVISPQEG